MTLYDIRFTGALVTQSPISIVPPNNPVNEQDGGKYNTVARHSIFDPATGTAEQRPVITASTIRGKLRRSASAICFALAGERPRLTPYIYSTIGDVKGSEKEDTYSINDRNARRQRNPVIALFGASKPWDMSRAHVEHAIAGKDQTMVVAGVRSDDFQRNADILELIEEGSVDDYIEKRENVKAHKALKLQRADLLKKLREAKSGGKAGEVERIEADLRALRTTLADAKKEAGNSMMLPHMHEAIIEGAVLTNRIILNRVTEAEAGLFLLALQHTFDQDPVFGAKRAIGYGLVNADWAVEIREGGVPGAKWKPAGSVSMKPYDEGVIDGDLRKLITAWEAYVATGAMNVLVDGAGDVGDITEAANDGEAAPKAKKKTAKAK